MLIVQREWIAASQCVTDSPFSVRTDWRCPGRLHVGGVPIYSCQWRLLGRPLAVSAARPAVFVATAANSTDSDLVGSAAPMNQFTSMGYCRHLNWGDCRSQSLSLDAELPLRSLPASPPDPSKALTSESPPQYMSQPQPVTPTHLSGLLKEILRLILALPYLHHSKYTRHLIRVALTPALSCGLAVKVCVSQGLIFTWGAASETQRVAAHFSDPGFDCLLLASPPRILSNSEQ